MHFGCSNGASLQFRPRTNCTACQEALLPLLFGEVGKALVVTVNNKSLVQNLCEWSEVNEKTCIIRSPGKWYAQLSVQYRWGKNSTTVKVIKGNGFKFVNLLNTHSFIESLKMIQGRSDVSN